MVTTGAKVLKMNAQLCPTLCDPMDCTVHGILQTRILEWAADLFSRVSSQPRDQNRSLTLQADSLPAEPPGKPSKEPDAMQEISCNTVDLGLIPGLGRSPGGGNGDPLQYFCLGISMDRGVWWTTLHGVARVKQYLVTKPPPPRDNLLNE